jgi:putative endonuclease
MKSYYVYILECSDRLLYTGFTNNISRRLEEHTQGKNKNSFTYTRRPIKLIFYQEFNNVLHAIYFEKKIKRWSSKKKRALANNDFDLLQILSECRNMTHFKYRPTDEEVSTALDQTK